jgi:hypothetical protein
MQRSTYMLTQTYVYHFFLLQISFYYYYYYYYYYYLITIIGVPTGLLRKCKSWLEAR